MNAQAARAEGSPAWTQSGAAGHGWMPAEAPLAMPRQSIDIDAALPQAVTPRTSPGDIAVRRAMLFGGAALLTAVLAIGPYVLLKRDEPTPPEVFGFLVFLTLSFAICTWFCNAVAGFWILSTGREQEDLAFAAHPPLPRSRTAILMPLYNEDPDAAFARLASLDASLHRLGASDAFDLFILSDTTKEPIAFQERQTYLTWRPRMASRLFMRRRTENSERKAGNIGEWVRRYGAAYPYMVVLDADSTMAGETVLRLVDAMERNPGVGLIETAPVVVGASSLYARHQQFGVRMFGRVAAAGLAWWTGAESTYWGHNAILRTRAFAQSAHLPVLRGEKPFGGHILSHDVVEAAMLRRAGWAVHVTAALDGSCEETPPSLLEFIGRDARWCQGNLQHIGLFNAPGLHPISKLQLGMGIMAYASSPLWCLGLMLGMVLQLGNPLDWSSILDFLHPTFSPFMLTGLMSAMLLFGPKVLGATLVLSRPGERRAFGGGETVLRGLAAEIGLSILLAPILMVANTVSVLHTLRGRDVGWRAQRRDAAGGVSWDMAVRAMRWQMFVGTLFLAGLCLRPDLSLCYAPVVLPLLASPWLVRLTADTRAGALFAQAGMLVVPDDDGVSVTPILSGPAAQLATGRA